MNAWSFIYAAYAISLIAMVALTGSSWRAMRRAEDRAERIGRD